MDKSVRQLARQYAAHPTDELAHQIAATVIRSGGIPAAETKRYGFFDICGECGQPTRTFEICSYLGYNPGVDGHFYQDEEAAFRAWQYFIEAIVRDRNEGRVNTSDYWTENPFQNVEEELTYLSKNIKLICFYTVATENNLST